MMRRLTDCRTRRSIVDDVLAPADDPRLPCIVGTARRTWHPGPELAPEPLEMWAQLAQAAVDDANEGSRRSSASIGRIDDLSLVHCQSWAYDHPVGRLADRLGVASVPTHRSILAGTSPQRLLDSAAGRMLRGEASVALVVGAEALHTRKVLARGAEQPDWSHPHPTPPVLPIDLDEWYLPTEVRHGVLPAWLTFALLEQARWAARGARPEDRRALGETMARVSAVAATEPGAWFPQERTADELLAPSEGNRLVATPYTKLLTAFMDVDMGAAHLLVTREVADAWGVPDDRRAYLRGWGFARDAVHLGARADLASSAGMRQATGEALAAAGLDADQIDLFDLYSCFGSAVQFAQDALGLAPDDPRPISLAGGLPYHGGPSSNYVGHSLGALVDRLRHQPEAVGMVTGVGMHMTKHVAGIWSGVPGPVFGRHEHGEQRWEGDPAIEERAVRDEVDGPISLLAATVVPSPTGDAVVAIGELDDGSRCYARSTDPSVVEVVATDAWVGLPAKVSAAPDGTNDLHL
jgi:acetyl-CoA C-acetyltransferase